MGRSKGPKFYAVRVGHKPGVYTTWPEAEANVKGYSGAVHQSFPTREEADSWLNAGRASSSSTTNQQQVGTSQGLQRGSDHSAPAPQGYTVHRQVGNSSFSAPEPEDRTVSSRLVGPYGRFVQNRDQPPAPRRQTSQPFLRQDHRPDSTTTSPSPAPPAKRTKLGSDAAAAASSSTAPPQSTTSANSGPVAIVYTDGAAPKNGKQGATAGIGVWFGADDPRNISARLPGPLQTNQRAELMAILYALQAFEETTSVEIRTDSQYSIGCVTEWYKNWVGNGWKSAKGDPVTNQDIIKPILDQVDKRNAAGALTLFTKVAGHSGDHGNDQADLLAVAGARSPPVNDS